MKKYGLVLEGGGMRGMFTVGVLDFFLEKNIEFKEIMGVSAGACHATSFISKQKGRAKKISLDYLNDKRYFGLQSLLKTGDFFGADFIYNVVPNQLNKFDYDTFNKSKTKLITCVTNIKTGCAEYLELKDSRKDMDYVRASASLPILSKNVVINDQQYLDGGISDAIPIKEMLNRKMKKVVVVLTRDEKYYKKQSKLSKLYEMKYKEYPELIKVLNNRHKVYNDTIRFIKEQEKLGNIFVIRPNYPFKVSRVEKNREKLKIAYKQGYEKAALVYNDMKKYLES